MSKEKSPAFQFYAAEYLADINVQCMSLQEEGMYARLLAYCWREGSLPTDKRLLQSLCKGASPTALVLGCFKEKNGVLIHNRLELERKKQEMWREQRSNAGKKGMAIRWNKQNKIDNSVITEDNGPVITGDNSSVFSLQSSVPEEPSNDLKSSHSQGAEKPKAQRPKDEAYEIWAEEFQEHRTVPYVNKKADFIQLAKLRKAFGLNGGGCPDGWLDAIHNYLGSPLTAYTLADLCTRFDCFVNGEVDRFGKPAGFNDVHQQNKATFRKLAGKGFFDEK